MIVEIRWDVKNFGGWLFHTLMVEILLMKKVGGWYSHYILRYTLPEMVV